MAEELQQSAPKLTPRISRSRCFRVFKWTLFVGVVALAILTLVSIPWCLTLTRDLLQDLTKNDTSLAAIYAQTSDDKIEVTDELVYIVVGVSVVLTLLYLTFGAIATLRESFCMSLFFGLTLLLGFAGSICYIKHLLFLINMAIDLVLGLLFIIYSLAIKRADRLAPECPDEIDEMQNKDARKIEEDKL